MLKDIFKNFRIMNFLNFMPSCSNQNHENTPNPNVILKFLHSRSIDVWKYKAAVSPAFSTLIFA